MAKLKRDGILLCLCGPAGVGKTILGKHLLESNPNMSRSVSVTSRPARADEVAGDSYLFLSAEEFKAKIDLGEFFEWEQVHGNYYGTLKSSLDGMIAAGRDVLLIVDIRGSLTFKERFPKHCVTVFVVPPSLKALKERISGRGSVSEQELTQRFNTTKEECRTLMEVREQSNKIDYLIVNDDLERAFLDLSNIVSAEKNRLMRVNAGDLGRVCGIDLSA